MKQFNSHRIPLNHYGISGATKFRSQEKKSTQPLLIPDFQSPMGDTKSKIIWSKQRLLRSVSTSARHHWITDGSFISWVSEIFCVHFTLVIIIFAMKLNCLALTTPHFAILPTNIKSITIKWCCIWTACIVHKCVCIEWYFMLKFNWSADASQTHLIEPFNLHNELKLSKITEKIHFTKMNSIFFYWQNFMKLKTKHILCKWRYFAVTAVAPALFDK